MNRSLRSCAILAVAVALGCGGSAAEPGAPAATKGAPAAAAATPPAPPLAADATTEAKEQNGKVVEGLGDVGIVTSTIRVSAEAKFIQRGTLVTVDFTAGDARSRMDAVADLARAVAARLP